MEIALAFVIGIVVGGTGVLLLFRSIAKQKMEQETDDDWWKKGEAPPY